MGDVFVDISHESLIRQWRRLSEWLQAEASSADAIRRIDDAAKRNARGEGEFLQGLELANLLRWRTDTAPSAAWASCYVNEPKDALAFLETSRGEARRRRRWSIALSGAVAGLVILVAGIWLYYQARHQADMSQEQALTAEKTIAEKAREHAVAAKSARADAAAEKRARSACGPRRRGQRPSPRKRVKRR